MREILRLSALTAAAVLLCGTVGRAQTVNGNATISASALGQPLSVSTSSQFAGAVSSIKWGGKEFINDWDHGRQFSSNSQFFHRYECYNPYEAGSKEDGQKPTSSSRLLSMTAAGHTIDSTTQMAWYLSTRETRPGYGDYCGDPKGWLPVPSPYTGPLSDYRVHKTLTIGFAGIPNVIEYLSELYIPERVEKGLNQIIAVMPYDFSSVRSYDIVSKDYRKVRALAGEDDLIKVVSTADGSYAMGFYAPELLQPYGDPGAANFWNVVPPSDFYRDPHNPSVPDPDFACVHVGLFNRYDSFNGPGYTHDRAYLVIGSLDQVKEGLDKLHLQFRALDPEVYNWQEYVDINGLYSLNLTQETAQKHWLTEGLPRGLIASKSFSAAQYLLLNSDVAEAYGQNGYQGAIDHYVTYGRAEGRSTVAHPAAGMQHLVGLANRVVNASGQNAFAQLGTAAPTSPTSRVASLDYSVTEVAAGDYTSFAVKTDGTLWTWGSNQYGARGDGSSGNNILDPVQVPLPNKISTPSRAGRHAVAVGTSAYAAIDTEGQVWTWGANWNGRLGDGTTAARYTPARVKRSSAPDDYLTGIVSIAAGGGTMAAVDADGTVWTWGGGANGALGNGATQDSPYPVQVVKADEHNQGALLVGISQVACGSSGFCVALARYGTVFAWGSNDFSQLGLPAGGALSIATPVSIDAGGAIDAIAAGSAHCIAHSQDGNVYGWGYNGRGQLGIGSIGVAQSNPIRMDRGPDNMGDISELAAGGNSSVMVRNSDRAIFVAGDNQSGQLGIAGNQSPQYVPVRSSY